MARYDTGALSVNPEQFIDFAASLSNFFVKTGYLTSNGSVVQYADHSSEYITY